MAASVQHPSSRVALDVAQLDRYMPSGKEISSAFGPLDEHERVRLNDVVPPDVLQVRQFFEAIQVHMMDRRLCRVILMHDGERRAGDVLLYAESLADGAGQGSLSGAGIARERNDERRRYLT